MTVTTTAWNSVTNYPELARTMVRFLKGELDRSPIHTAPLDPESSSITADLVALTRHGLITHGSQPGLITKDLQQRACVDLLVCDEMVAAELVVALGHTELVVLVALPGVELRQDLPMTRWDGRFVTWAGRIGEGERPFWYCHLNHEVCPTVASMCFVQVLDPQWGRDRYLWDCLLQAAAELELSAEVPGLGSEVAAITRAQGLESGWLVDASATAAEAGLGLPMALTRRAWDDLVTWTADDEERKASPTGQSIDGRLWDVCWMARAGAAEAEEGATQIEFELLRVPRHGKSVRAEEVTAILNVGPGDQGEQVLTILLPGES